jgi:FkbM family methyltransferase
LLKRSPKTIVDAGANVGFTTLFFASQYPHARIIAIEPSPRSVELLRMNVAGLPNVTIVEAALWAKTEDLLLEDIPGRSWGAHVDQKGTYTITWMRCSLL